MDKFFDSKINEQWLESLKSKDATLFAELSERLSQRLATPETVPAGPVFLESMAQASDEEVRGIVLETIVREGRPAIPVLENRISFNNAIADQAANTIVDRLKEQAAVVEACIPLVGRIDIDNYPGSLTYAGTAWLVEPNVAVTNRHVAELIASSNNGKFKFRPGRLGEELRVTVDYRHEMGMQTSEVVRVLRVIWIEPSETGPDIAFLELERTTDGTRKSALTLAESDLSPNSEVVVIGYPARAPAHIIPNQQWMDQIYGGTYDVKRIAPGLMGGPSRGWSTHDCTTLGGNSGSVVIDMKTGAAVALHFAGLYMIENYAVPISTVRSYLKQRPWQGESTAPVVPASETKQTTKVEALASHGEVTVTIPLTITVSLGSPVVGGPTPQQTNAPGPRNIDEAAVQLHREHSAEPIFKVWAGFKIEDGKLTDVECLVVWVHPDKTEAVRKVLPATFANFPVEVRPAPASEMMAASGLTTEAASSISYNDTERVGPGFSFDWVDEEMSLTLHVGPERSWVVLSEFLKDAKKELVSSMYEFHAAHIAKGIEEPLNGGASLKLVLARQSRDPKNNKIEAGDFDRSETFERWEQTFKKKFDCVFVPLGATGLVASAYHIKVTVADRSKVWLSSGNWKRTSQPLIPDASLNDPKVTSKAGNREWHVVLQNKTLAERFRNHIRADFERSLELGGEAEGVAEEPLVDVPMTFLEGVELEAAATKVLEPLQLSRRIRVKPLLTPDKSGAVFSKAVLRLIRSAETQLLFQNQYVSMKGADSGFFKQLVDALAEKAQELDDFRMILRRENDALQFDLSQLKRRGIDVENQVKLLSNTHTKGIVVDGKQVLIGSHNWSSLGVTLNRDASLIFDDKEVAAYYTEAFEIDWNRSSKPRLDKVVNESVRPAEGSEPRPGSVRMTLSDYLEG